ncbi:inhibin beta C chain [Phasianus colchicus]|uniref:Inhibin subunit beta C n=1 Tax=Phasianus colchicus TaxID=9054 RepID=A0A669Q256_PHACC|nr:inhibin beta C chain [Phasianus colchicus]
MAAVLAFLLLLLSQMASPHGAPRCPMALTPPAQRRALLATAQHSILTGLHLPERPRAPRPPPRAALLSALRRVQPQLNRGVAPPRPPNTAGQNYEVLSFAEAGPSTPRSSRLLFRFSQELRENSEVLQAQLHVFWPPPGPGSSQPVAVRLLHGDAASNGTALSEAMLEVRGEGWNALDVSDALRSVLSRGTERLTVELNASRPPLPTYGWDDRRPFVAVRARIGTPPSRRRRGIDCSGSTRTCCRKEFFVDFKEIGWEDWIIQPEGYHMNYCAGLCPPHVAAVPGVAASFHTAVLNLIKANNADAAADSCCVPTQRRPLSLLYYDRDSNIVKTDIPDMIVDACGCT